MKCINDPLFESFVAEEKSHGRQETRLHIVGYIPDKLVDVTFAWEDLKKIGVAVNYGSLIVENNKEVEMSVRYYIGSSNITAKNFVPAIRGH